MNEPFDVSDSSKNSLFNLPGQQEFYQVTEEIINREPSLALLSIEIDGLNFILRTFGPHKRNDVINEVGRRINAAAGDNQTPFRISQDCFALPLRESSYEEAIEKASLLSSLLKRPVDVHGVAYRLDAYIGISHYPSDATTIEELVRTSSFACYLSRDSNSDYTVYDFVLDERARERFNLLVDLEKALIDRSGLDLAYQPIIDLERGSLSGVEALCRWTHPTLGQIPPGSFIPYVEQTSLIMPLTETTLKIGLEDLAHWVECGLSGSVAINLSPSAFKKPDLLDRLESQLRHANVNPSKIHFEITETGIMEQSGATIEVLSAIRDWGSKIAIDDFGTGHSSLAYLADLPVDLIKIDKRFVKNISLPWGEAIVGATAMLAEKLGLITVAEGIETEAQFERCRELGVNLGQGYYIGRPMPKQVYSKWVHGRDYSHAAEQVILKSRAHSTGLARKELK